MKKIAFIFILGTLLYGCTPVEPPVDAPDKDALSKEVLAVMRDYAASWNVNAEELIKHYLNSKEFIFFSDGMFWDYGSWDTNIRQLFDEGISYKGDPYKDIHVCILSDKSAFFTCKLDYIMIDTTDAETRVGGAVTYVLVKDGDTWKIVHGIASHNFDE